MNNNNIHVLSRGIIVDQGHILLAYDPRPQPYHYYELNRDFYYLPGGHIDVQESARTALIREIKEETGLDAEIEQFLGIIEHAWSFPGDEICCHTHEINMMFKICITGLSLGDTVPQKEDHIAFQWMPLAHVQAIDVRPLPLLSALPHWLTGRE
jgi:8-oxo-dGTP diphosphatase